MNFKTQMSSLYPGDGLDPDICEKLARSVASTGDDASARLQMEEKGEKITKQLKRNPAVILQEDVTDEPQKLNLLKQLREYYHRIRRGGGNRNET